MRLFTFFFTRIFLRKPILALVTVLLLGMANYIAFSASRTVFSTLEGYEQVGHITSPDIYVENLDPESEFNVDAITNEAVQSVYDRLESGYSYGFFTDGYVADVKNARGIEVSVAYMNQTYADLNGFEFFGGPGLRFNYDLEHAENIPVLVGKGLANEYPVGKQFTVRDPALDKELTFHVSGILKANSSHTNLYALDSKQYYNFSIVVPVNTEFIAASGIPFKINGLMDLIVTNTDRRAVNDLAEFINRQIGVKFNFFSQQENIDFYESYFVSSIVFLAVVSMILLSLIIGLSVWGTLIGVRLMMREFTLNLLVGLNYGKFRRFLFLYYSGVSWLALTFIFVLASYSRFSAWNMRDGFFITIGFAGGLIPMDWVGLFSAFLLNAFLTTIFVCVVNWRLKRVPISVGVLQ